MADIIYISNPLLADNKTSSHHIVWELSKSHRILYLESGGMRTPEISKSDLHKIADKLKGLFRPPRKIHRNLYLYKLINLPFHGSKLAQEFNKLFTIVTIKILKNYLNLKNITLWIFPPDYGNLIGHLDEKRSVYYCVDDYSHLPGVNGDAIRTMERELLRKVDVAFFTSKKLYNDKKHLTRNPNYSPHSVDYAHFSRAQTDDLRVPEDISHLRSPIIGFVGLVEKWMDLDLINYLATKRMEWNFVFIGRIATDISSIDLPNVRFLGFREYRIVPSYLANFDVCIIPFKNNQLTNFINPIKLKEYLATGKPVVSTYMPELEDNKKLIGIANDYDDFLWQIEYALNNNTPDSRHERIKSVFVDTWEERVNTVWEKIENVKLKSSG